MDRAFWEKLEFTALLLAQLVGFALFLAALIPPSDAAQPPTSMAADIDTLPAKLGTFLNQYPITKAQPKLLANQSLMQLGQGAFVGYRAFKDKAAGLVAYKAVESFGKECVALGGHFETKANRAEVAAHYSIARKATFDGNDLSVCVDADEIPLGALIASSYTNRHKESFVSLFVMTQETVTEMMSIYHRGMAKELRQQADIAEKLEETDARIAAWRTRLSVGTDTHCGPVLDVRGPVAQVAYGTRESWVRIERLYPPQDANSCREFSNN